MHLMTPQQNDVFNDAGYFNKFFRRQIRSNTIKNSLHIIWSFDEFLLKENKPIFIKCKN